MGCSCRLKIKTEENEVQIEQYKDINEGVNTTNVLDIEDSNNNRKRNENSYVPPQIMKKSKTQIISMPKEKIQDEDNISDLDQEILKNNYQKINTNKMTQEELNDLLIKYESINDSVLVEIRPTTVCENQAIYYGEWNKKDNNRHGRGILLWPDGSKYTGQWRNNYASGKGKLIHSNGDIYEGEWDNDKPNGYGEYIRIDGSKYKGNWKNDKQDGKGEEIWADGSKYEGDFNDGKKNGYGIFTWIDGNRYEGNFKDNYMDGKGKYIFKDKSVYEGEWNKNKIEGKGIFIWPDNRKYEGEFKNGKKDGYGTYTLANGKIYRGNWKEGKKNGEGEVYIPNLNIWKKGIWDNGKIIKWIN